MTKFWPIVKDENGWHKVGSFGSSDGYVFVEDAEAAAYRLNFSERFVGADLRARVSRQPGAKRSIPESFVAHVHAAVATGRPLKEIADESGVTYAKIYSIVNFRDIKKRAG